MEESVADDDVQPDYRTDGNHRCVADDGYRLYR